ncbi:maleylpyruvate isomerase N-terminal domain-containing protein [Haloechinothrix salitolerans]|uniref:Maleylpyruvate isomerase N-terminal domain-containing protein n=1 Tax=Haloechinothrix salitolerans TaxID=926830 RepID=A0ABW2C7X9_9PSEU
MNAITGAVHPTSTWNTHRWTEVVQHHAGLLRGAVSQAEPDLPVPTTPGWTFRDITLHVGRFAAQVTQYLTTRSIVMLPPPPVPDDDPVEYLDQRLAALHEALAATPANVPVWTLSPAAPDLAWVWHRRAAHELNLRRWEAQAALRTLDPTERDLAVDGIDETLTTLLPAKYGTEIPVTVTGTVLVSATDGPESWRITLTPGEIPATRAAMATDHADAHLSSTAADLHYHLRDRTHLEGHGSPALLRAIIVE